MLSMLRLRAISMILTIYGLLMVALAAVAWLSYYGYMTSTSWMGHSVLLTLRKQMFGHLQKLSMSFFDRNEVGRIMSRVQNDVTPSRIC